MRKARHVAGYAKLALTTLARQTRSSAPRAALAAPVKAVGSPSVLTQSARAPPAA